MRLALISAGPPTADAPVVRGYFGIGAESGTRASRFECKDRVAVNDGRLISRV